MFKFWRKKFCSKNFIENLVKNQKSIELDFKEPKIDNNEMNLLKKLNYDGLTNLRKGDYFNAYKSYETNFNLLSKYYDNNHPAMISCLNNIGIVLKFDNKVDEAIDIFKKVIESYNSYFGLEHKNTLISLMNLGKVYKETNKYHDSINIYEYILKNDLKSNISNINYINMKIMLAGCYREIQDFQKNKILLEKIDIDISKLDSNNQNKDYLFLKSNYYLSKGLSHQFKKEYELAKKNLLKSESIRLDIFKDQESVEIVRIQYYLYNFFTEIKDEENSNIYKNKIKKIDN